MFECYVRGTGRYAPERVLTNHDLEKMVDTSDEWIRQRTGIAERRIVADDESMSDLATRAAQAALDAAEIEAGEIDAIVLATVTPDTYCPAGAVYVQEKIGAKNACAFDISAACTGFVYGVSIATGFIRSGLYKNVLVIGAEALSRMVDFEDRNTCILFGDGAGAAVLSRAEEGNESSVLDVFLRTDGGGADLIIMPGGGSKMPASLDSVESRQHFLTMQGREVFKFATRTMVELIEKACERGNIGIADLDLIVPHQVNQRIVETVLRKIEIPPEKLHLNLERFGNTSAASVPMALHEAIELGKLKRGDLVLLVAFGAGLTWGYNLIRW